MGVGGGVVTLTSGLNGLAITANSIRFLSRRSTGFHTIVVTSGNFSSTSLRPPLCFGAAHRVLSSFT